MQSAVSKVAGLTDADKWVLTVVLPNSGIFTTVFPLVSGNLFEIWTAITEQLYILVHEIKGEYYVCCVNSASWLSQAANSRNLAFDFYFMYVGTRSRSGGRRLFRYDDCRWANIIFFAPNRRCPISGPICLNAPSLSASSRLSAMLRGYQVSTIK